MRTPAPTHPLSDAPLLSQTAAPFFLAGDGPLRPPITRESRNGATREIAAYAPKIAKQTGVNNYNRFVMEMLDQSTGELANLASTDAAAGIIIKYQHIGESEKEGPMSPIDIWVR